MAHEMTPQERAAAFIKSTFLLHLREDGEPCDGDIEDVIAHDKETRRAALLEAAQVIEDDCYGGVDYFSDADTTLSFTDQMKRAHNKNQAKLAEHVRKLAQEGCGWTL